MKLCLRRREFIAGLGQGGGASACSRAHVSRAFLNGERGWCVIMMLKTFMDETGIHDDAEMVAVSGYICNPKAWRAWTMDWNIHKRRVPSGRSRINVFHSTDCANCQGEFEGWSKEERDLHVAQLLPVIPAHPPAGVVIGVHLPALADA
jgi:hypothetical protein